MNKNLSLQNICFQDFDFVSFRTSQFILSVCLQLLSDSYIFCYIFTDNLSVSVEKNFLFLSLPIIGNVWFCGRRENFCKVQKNTWFSKPIQILLVRLPLKENALDSFYVKKFEVSLFNRQKIKNNVN